MAYIGFILIDNKVYIDTDSRYISVVFPLNNVALVFLTVTTTKLLK